MIEYFKIWSDRGLYHCMKTYGWKYKYTAHALQSDIPECEKRRAAKRSFPFCGYYIVFFPVKTVSRRDGDITLAVLSCEHEAHTYLRQEHIYSYRRAPQCAAYCKHREGINYWHDIVGLWTVEPAEEKKMRSVYRSVSRNSREDNNNRISAD